jgi:hypothetical protein
LLHHLAHCAACTLLVLVLAALLLDLTHNPSAFFVVLLIACSALKLHRCVDALLFNCWAGGEGYQAGAEGAYTAIPCNWGTATACISSLVMLWLWVLVPRTGARTLELKS